MAYMVVAYAVMAYTVVAYALSYGLRSHGLRSHGLCSYGREREHRAHLPQPLDVAPDPSYIVMACIAMARLDLQCYEAITM